MRSKYSAVNPMDNDRDGIRQDYPTFVTGGGEFHATGVGPRCEYTSKDGADKATESKTFKVSGTYLEIKASGWIIEGRFSLDFFIFLLQTKTNQQK